MSFDLSNCLKSLAVGLGLLSVLASGSACAEDLFTVYQQAKNSDPQVAASEASYLATLEKRPQALAGLKPQVTLSSNATYRLSYNWGETARDGAAQASAGYSLNITKPLVRPQVREQVSQADIQIAQAQEALFAEQQNLVVRVADAYFNYLKARDSADFSRKEANAIGRQNEQVKAYFEAGRSTITDVKEAGSRFDEAKANIVVADQNVEIALEGLRTLTGKSYLILRGATENTPLIVPMPKNVRVWSPAATQFTKQVKSAQYSVQLAQKAVDVIRAGKKPTIDLFATHSGSIARGEFPSDQESTDATIGVRLNATLYDGGRVDSSIREARYNFHGALQRLELQKRSAVQQVRATYLNILTGLTQVNALKRSLQSSRVAAQATQDGFRAGTRTAVDVLLSLRQTYGNERNYSAARYDFLLNTIKLKQASGTLVENDLRILSRILGRSRTTRSKPLNEKFGLQAPVTRAGSAAQRNRRTAPAARRVSRTAARRAATAAAARKKAAANRAAAARRAAAAKKAATKKPVRNKAAETIPTRRRGGLFWQTAPTDLVTNAEVDAALKEAGLPPISDLLTEEEAKELVEE